MISKEEWKKIAPKADDKAKLAARFRAEGLPLDPSCGFLNGVPIFTKPVDDKVLLAIIEGKAQAKKSHKK